MKILISNDGMHAHFHERLSWTNALNTVPGISAMMYNVQEAAAFDIFDYYEPDIFIGQSYNLDEATIKCIKSRPHLKVALRSGEYNDDLDDLNVLRVTNEELEKMSNIHVDFIYTHYTQENIEKTHHKFIDDGYTLLGVPMSADLNTYFHSSYKPELECDISFVGGYWPYKGQVLDKYLLPLCSCTRYNIKIFGNQPWNVNQYCGIINDNEVANLFRSSKICPNLSEPHAQTRGIDVNERTFKVLAAGGFVISDYVDTLVKMYPMGGVVFATSPKDFREKVEYYLNNEEERLEIADIGRKWTIDYHTNYHRVADMLEAFGEDIFVEEVKKAKDVFLNDYLNNFF